jgi:type IV secretion system protein VirB2
VLNFLHFSLVNSVAQSIGVIALAAAGCTLVFGGELGEFGKRICMIVMACSMMILAANFMRVLGFFADPAADIAAGTLPWEGPLIRIRDSLRGPAAKAIGTIAISVTGAMLAFGGEISELSKRMIMAVMAISVMIFSGNILTTLGFV